MNDKNKLALAQCIVKWTNVLIGTESEKSAKNCALCQLYNGNEDYNDLACEGCPVFKATGRLFCRGTPYELWNNHLVTEHNRCSDETIGRFAICRTCRQHAYDEVEFLKSLLPNVNNIDIEKLQDELAKAKDKLAAVQKIVRG